MAKADCTIGIVAAPAHRAELRRLAEEAGCRIAVCQEPGAAVATAATGPAIISGVAADLAVADDAIVEAAFVHDVPRAWLLDATAADDGWLEAFVDHCETPLLICDEPMPAEHAERRVWCRRLLGKLEELVAALAGDTVVMTTGDAPVAVWILAASTGGPRAVSEFLGALAPGLPIALVYAQHIDTHFDRTLAAGLERHRHYGIDLGEGEQRLLSGRLLVVPADRQLRFLPFHRVVTTRAPWDAPYQPGIDQVVSELARLNPHRCGVIIFSGLCNDGAFGCRVLQDKGGQVWVQSPGSCISPSMPEAALATGTVTLQGTPHQLAEALNTRYGRSLPEIRKKQLATG